MKKEYSMESELTEALVRFSYGRIPYDKARKKAAEAVPNFDSGNEVLTHKGINWYAKELLKVI